ncbi:hypothetical protein J3P96_07680 [Pseudomonas sp. R3-56]|uniref:hypothetical protein n=1 Tax=Pseudomonas sp. R3-56 TaxID=2817401 RepID=UPI003DA86C4B
MAMTLSNPAPTIPLLGPDNAVDLEELGAQELETFIKYDGLADADFIVVNWFGCGEFGEIVDKSNDEVEVIGDEITPDGMPVLIENSLLQALRNGTVFYSYRVRKPGGTPGDESLRLFFYVGKRPRSVATLPVLQIRESHDLHLSLDMDGPSSFKPWVAPYQAMAAGDTVTLYCRRFDPEGVEDLPALAYPQAVREEEVGKPLGLFLNRSDLLRFEGGSTQVHYGIQYAGAPAETTQSPAQTFKLLAATSARLPRLEIDGHDGGTLNPALFPQGLLLRIAGYPGMEVGDELLCHVSSSLADVAPVILRARVDVSTLGKGFFELHLDAGWVAASQGGAIDLRYQYAWQGTARSAEPYSVNVREPLHLPMVIVHDALPDPDDPAKGEGILDVTQKAISGVNLSIDPLANYGPEDLVQVHWEGYGTGGKYIATVPMSGRTYNILPQFIPSNLGKAVRVYYTVQQSGEPAAVPSEVFTVRILPIEKDRYLTIQSKQAQMYNGTIYVSRIPSEGELFTLPSWLYMREGQIVNAHIHGKNSAGDTLVVAILEQYPVTAADVTNRKIEKGLAQSSFSAFQPGAVNVQVKIVYEPGAETLFSPARFTLA